MRLAGVEPLPPQLAGAAAGRQKAIDNLPTLGVAALGDQMATVTKNCRLADQVFELRTVGCDHRRHVHQPTNGADYSLHSEGPVAHRYHTPTRKSVRVEKNRSVRVQNGEDSI